MSVDLGLSVTLFRLVRVMHCFVHGCLAALAFLGILASAQAQTGKPIVKIAGFNDFKLVLFQDGSVGGWGDVRDGQLGPRAAIPAVSGHSTSFVSIALPGKAVDVAAGSRTAYALLEDGTVLAWGYGVNGELGCGQPCRQGTETPQPIQGLRDVTAITAGPSTAFAIHRDGTVSAWGSHGMGLFGDGKSPRYLEAPEVSLTPVKLAGISGISQLSAGGSYVLAVTTTGHVVAWGKLVYGVVHADDPVEAAHEIPGFTDVAQVSATSASALLKKDGTVWAWGNNGQGQFGNGRRNMDERSRVPVQVPGATNVVSLCGGANGHFLGLRRDGTIVAWGNSDWGQAGSGRIGEAQTSVATLSLRNISKVFAIGANSFALDTSGNLWIWGAGSVYGAWPMKPNARLPLRVNIPDGLVAAPATKPPAKPRPKTPVR